MSFFKNMNRKEKRKFNKLSPDEQAPIIEAELIQKVSPVMAKEIANSMIVGRKLVWKELYDDFVVRADSAENAEEWERVVGELLSTIRLQYLSIESNGIKKDVDIWK